MQKWNKLSRNISFFLTALRYKRRYSSIPKVYTVKSSYSSCIGTEPLLDWTVGYCVNNAAEQFPTDLAVCMCEQNISKTFAEVKKDVDQLASSFIALGLKRGEQIGIWSLNRYEWVQTQFAAAKAGLILVCINPGYKLKEMHYCLNKVAISTLVTGEGVGDVKYYELLSNLLPTLKQSERGCLHDENVPKLKNIIMFTEADHKGIFKFSDILKMGQESDLTKLIDIEEQIQFDDPVKILFTSGTSGKPKAVILSHHNIVNNSYNIGKRLTLDVMRPVACVPLPLFHAFACCSASLLGMIHGLAMIYPSGLYSAAAVVNAIVEHKATLLYGTPTVYIDLLTKMKQENLQLSLDFGVVGASTCPPELFVAITNELNMKALTNAYGTTEASPAIAATNHDDSLEIRSNYVGYAMNNTEIKVMDKNDQIVPVGSPGELWVRGYHIMLGYWNDEEQTAASITKHRWYKTGDIVSLHDNGYLKFLGRLHELIIRGGENIYPFDIEEYLNTHPKIADAHIIGVPDERMGEELCACICLKDKSVLTEDEVKNYCIDQIAHYKVPKYVMFIKTVPRTFTGKAQKFQLREEAIKELKLSG